MSGSTSPGKYAPSAVFGVGATAVALAIGLPFLYVILRVAAFYHYADAGFGYWMATRALPGWAFVAVVLGLIIGIRSTKRKRTIAFALGQACLWSIGLAAFATALSFTATTPLRAAAVQRYGLPPTPLSHVLIHHLFDSREEQKLQFDVCLLSENSAAIAGETVHPFTYEFCIPDVAPLRMQIQTIDTTARLIGAGGQSGCGSGSVMFVGTTRQQGAKEVLLRLAALPFVRRITPTLVE